MEELWLKYPFTKKAIDYLKNIKVDLDVIRRDKSLVEETIREIESVFMRKNHRNYLIEIHDPLRNLLVFYLSVLFLRTVSNTLLNSKFAVHEAKKYYALLSKEPEDFILSFAKEEFNIGIREEEVYGAKFYSLHFVDYLKYAAKLSGPWSLINQVIKNGYVLITRNQLNRILQEAVRIKILNMVDQPLSNKELIREIFPEEVQYLINLCEKYLKPVEIDEHAAVKISDENITVIPPCMVKIMNDIKRGVNVPHAARFAITAFLLNIGKTVDEVVELFSSAPDFDERKTRYQVEHIAGLRGSGIRYTTFKCENMKALGFCYPNKLCKRVKHPLQYYRLALRLMKYGKREK
ncbi:MAG: hypothetical protein DRN04_00190 [Thermoprotei archaeon]|nr:MAG: hypothetical protein DRN04_00190 [Thermoprotei archaeon]